VVAALEGLVAERLGLPVAAVQADSARLSPFLAALSLLVGGNPRAAAAVRAALAGSHPPIVHAHNLLPTFGFRALAAARAAGAKVVLHLHQFRLVCAVGVCFTAGRPCTRCHGRNTLPGLIHRCRGGLLESSIYAASLALWQSRVLANADLLLFPSNFARERLRALGVDLADRPSAVLYPPVVIPPSPAPRRGGYALVASRLSAEKGVDVAVQACARARVPLIVAGEGPERPRLERLAQRLGAKVTFAGRLGQDELAELRRQAAVAVVPSRSENFPTAAAEAMACGLPVVATAVGGTGELVPAKWLVPAEEPERMAERIVALWGDEEAGEEAVLRVRRLCDPELVAARLADHYRRLTGP